MFFKSALIAAVALEGTVSAFPYIAEQVAARNAENPEHAAMRRAATHRRSAGNVDGLIPRIPALTPFPEWPGSPRHGLFNLFDAELQKVSVTGEHEYRAPQGDDKRGPCAGLNAAANHGYLPRDGIATPETVNTGLWEAFGLDETATLFLQTATMLFDGDPISGKWSIGVHSPKTNSLGALGDVLGNQTGICAYGHLKTEGDASITRGDWLAPEDNSNCQSYPKFAKELFDLADKRTGGRITPQVMAEHQYNRKQHSIATNPNYYSPAYAGIAFTFGAHMFAFELLANHSDADPRGFLEQSVFEQFFGYTRDANNELVFTFGTERIPENWYKRHPLDAWTLVDILISTAQQCTSYPSNCQVGGNSGKVNSFVGVDLGNITGGLLNSVEEFSDPNVLGCFISQQLQADVPSFLDNLVNGKILGPVLNAVSSKLVPALRGLGECKGAPKGRGQYFYGPEYSGFQPSLEGERTGMELQWDYGKGK